jgi:uncharacterized protein (DUF983 family)
MFEKGSIIYSITKNKCPRCQEGDFFKNSNPYALSSFTQQHEGCSHCKLHYEIEPGFFYGSMYVSYAFNIAWFVTMWIATSVLTPEITKTKQFLIIVAAIILLYPISFRYARILYLNIFVKFQSEEKTK